MQTEINEKMGEFYKVVSKPLTKITELNITTLNELSSHTGLLNKLAQAKKPEDFIATQVEIMTATAEKGIEYLQQASTIWLDAMSQTGNVFATVARDVRETTKKAGDAIKPSKL